MKNIRRYMASMLSLIVAACSYAQENVWDAPVFGFSNDRALSVERVIFAENSTMVEISVNTDIKTNINLSSETYLKVEGKEYPIIKASKIELDKECKLNKQKTYSFTLHFKPIPFGVKKIHLLSKQDEGYLIISNIHSADSLNTVTLLPDSHYLHKTDSLPVSRFCPDSTFVDISIQNYVAEAGSKVRLNYYGNNIYIAPKGPEFDISADGKARIAFCPHFPQTVYINIGDSRSVYLVVVPGGTLSLQLDMGSTSHDIDVVSARGDMDDVNYGINTTFARNIIKFNNSKAYTDSILVADGWLTHASETLYFQYRDKILNSTLLPAVKEWLQMNNDIRFYDHLKSINHHCIIRLLDELNKVENSILINHRVKYLLSTEDFAKDDWQVQKKMTTSDKMTLFPYFYMFWDGKYKDGNGNVKIYNKDIDYFFSALREFQYGDYDGSKAFTKHIQDTDMRSYMENMLDTKSPAVKTSE